MINIIDKKDCVGCNGCVQCCPKQCISFIEDEQGFHYPQVDVMRCIECGLCEKVCPVINQGDKHEPSAAYAAHCLDPEILMQSSSGGMFSVLAEDVLSSNGVVFGARFDDRWMVMHDYIESVDKLSIFRGSKYVQSQIGSCYKQVKEFINSGRLVMFSGTPCQIAGLRLFLGKEYENLLLVEVICHGVPSPRIWRDYLMSVTDNSDGSIVHDKRIKYNEGAMHIKHISFRDKRRGWEKYGFSLIMADSSSKYQTLQENEYMQVFLRDLDLRPSCYACPSKCGKSQSDIIIGDYWRVSHLEYEAYCQDGTSLILVNTPKGENALRKTGIHLIKTDYSKALSSNESLKKSALKPRYYDYFWNRYYKESIASIPATLKHVRGSFLSRLMRYTVRQLKSLLG